MKYPVVIFSSEADLHSFAVQKVLRERYSLDSVVLDLASYPSSPIDGDSFATIELTTDGPVARFSKPEIVLDRETAVWWRRPQPFSIPPEVTESVFRQFSEDEWKTTIDGALLASGCRVVNDFVSQRRANNKILQLQVARSVGFQIPQTVVTNCMADAAELIKSLPNGAIYKPQTHSKYHVADAREVDESFMSRSKLLRIAPVMVQELIPADHDLRINVAGNRVFATKIPTAEREGLIDWRLALDLPMIQTQVHEEVRSRCLALTRGLGLECGAIDLRVTPNGDIVFFEINPAGQFLFCEIDGTLEITEAYCRAILGLD